MFDLHPQLENDCIILGQFPLSLLLLHRDANYPWFILVPRRPGVREIFQLDESDQVQLLRESSQLSEVLMDIFSGDKLNVAALGNMVPQLHLHHIVRFRSDPAWPAPVWGAVEPCVYSPGLLRERAGEVTALLGGDDFEVYYRP